MSVLGTGAAAGAAAGNRNSRWRAVGRFSICHSDKSNRTDLVGFFPHFAPTRLSHPPPFPSREREGGGTGMYIFSHRPVPEIARRRPRCTARTQAEGGGLFFWLEARAPALMRRAPQAAGLNAAGAARVGYALQSLALRSASATSFSYPPLGACGAAGMGTRRRIDGHSTTRTPPACRLNNPNYNGKSSTTRAASLLEFEHV